MCWMSRIDRFADHDPGPKPNVEILLRVKYESMMHTDDLQAAEQEIESITAAAQAKINETASP